MPSYKQVTFTTLELKGLLLRAEIQAKTTCPEIDRDPELAKAADNALDKLMRAHLGVGRKPSPPPSQPHRGPELNLRRVAR